MPSEIVPAVVAQQPARIASGGLAGLPPESLQALLAPSLISAEDDLAAVGVWLRARAARSANTMSAYSRAAATFLLWLHEQGVPGLRAVTVEHTQAYLQHLSHPPAHWVRPRHRRGRDDVLQTQVLMGPASSRSIAWHRAVIAQMLGYLADSRYLSGNAMRLTSKPAVIGEGSVERKALTLADWAWLRTWIEARGDGPSDHLNVRDHWVVTFLYHTGLRRHEAAAALARDVVRDDSGWSLRVVGKGSKERYVTLNMAVMDAMRAYRRSLNLPETPGPAEATPLIVRLRRNTRFEAMAPRSIGRIVEGVFERAAADCDDERTRAALLCASTHTMRHTNASHRLAAGADLETTQDELGHADINTTRSYAHTQRARRRADAEKLGAMGLAEQAQSATTG